MKMIFLNVDEYLEFCLFCCPQARDKGQLKRRRRKEYDNLTNKYNTIEELLNSRKGTKEPGVDNLIIYILLAEKIQVKEDIHSILTVYGKRIIEYFKILDGIELDFWEQFESLDRDRKAKKFFINAFLRVFIFLNKYHLNEIEYSDLKILKSEKFNYDTTYKSGFCHNLIHIIMNLKTTDNKLKIQLKQDEDINKYGTYHVDLINKMKNYLEQEYIDRRQKTKTSSYAIRAFYKWLKNNHEEISKVKHIDEEHWYSFKNYIYNSEKIKPRTRQIRTNHTKLFLQWLQKNGYIKKEIVNASEKYRGYVECEPMMFVNREHKKKIIAKVIGYVPKNEKEELMKHFILVIADSGLRFSECLWIGPECLVENEDGIGEIFLQIREKLGRKNKTTSILPLGLKSIVFLEERFRKIEKKKFYHEQSEEYFYSLFTYESKLLTDRAVYAFYNKIIKDIEFKDDDGKVIDYSYIKFHAFRHQKFNDIYEVTNGSLYAVKVDSGHTQVEMTRKYTRQQEEKRKRKAMELIEEGKIVGKGAEILKELLKSQYEPSRYLKIVEKMNLVEIKENGTKKYAMKYLGFGYCCNESCEVTRTCEECDFFYTCDEFKIDLKDRYARNFLLLKANMAKNINLEEITQNQFTLIKSLKSQEKILRELGINQEELLKLRTMGCESE
ncbi:site-specific integrase [Inediibacterium massiliense]|uniref:site-specific integrase n=1 Tax=Inediibacterium massiliense TaxID=1658111 RepID=UPI0006B4558C|nr:site-specific integrase [Inediibacterium massiliense]